MEVANPARVMELPVYPAILCIYWAISENTDMWQRDHQIGLASQVIELGSERQQKSTRVVVLIVMLNA